ncbi:MAG TPA: anti-sigma regulatory factor [Gemmatimonadales bacterium]|nr:anti-sigma regulatory factor [Gemmatimonadales bacterium]
MATEARVTIHSPSDIVTARQQGRRLATQVGFEGMDLTVVATAISEVARNIIEYARSGEILIRVVHDGGRRGLMVQATDEGPGIADVEQAMLDGYSTGKGLGIGLPGAKRLMDDFEVHSSPGRGTTIVMRKWLNVTD